MSVPIMETGITSSKQNQLAERMRVLGVREADLVEKFVTGSGKGGQKINKTSSCVYLFHRPSGEEVKCQRSRFQSVNRFLARRELCERLDEQIRGAQSARRQAAEKIRRQKRRKSRRQKARMIEQKHQRSEIKRCRGRVSSHEE